jgi:hypothetical protein
MKKLRKQLYYIRYLKICQVFFGKNEKVFLVMVLIKTAVDEKSQF